jgi:hypothetical protein
MGVTLTVFFDDPFFAGLFERVEGGRLTVAKVVFGADPSDGEVYAWLMENYYRLRFSPAIDGVKEVRIAANPKTAAEGRRLNPVRPASAPGRSRRCSWLGKQPGRRALSITRAQREAEEERRYFCASKRRRPDIAAIRLMLNEEHA